MSKADVVNEICKSARVNYPRRNVILKDIDDLWQADLIDMQAMSRVNGGYKYILAVIDCFSKFAWACGLKKKSKEHVSNAFKTILENKRIPKNLQTDHGKEFYNDQFQNIMNKFNINHYSTYSTKKASIVERFIRTLKSKLYRQFHLNGNYKWNSNVLNKTMFEYNNTIHRTTGLPPAVINQDNKIIALRRYMKLTHQKQNINKCNKFQVGDYVRISKYKACFEKSYTPNWSTEIFKIKKVQETNPTTYILEDSKCRPILGAFYSQELQKTKNYDIYLVERVLKRKGNYVYVKWLGLPTSENSWINKKNAL